MAFYLLLVAPSGLRDITLRRCVRIWAETLEPQTDYKILAAAVDQFLEFFERYLVRTFDEQLGGLDDVLHPYEQILSYAVDELVDDEFVLWDFALEECRKNFSERADQLELRNAHLILAEEAIRQQTIIFRHGPEVSAQFIRPFRRLLQGLYHGALSLPTTAEINGKPTIKSPLFAIPHEWEKAWSWLTHFLYRRLLEAPPAWHLTRSYGADRLKLEILQLLQNPGQFRVNSGGLALLDALDSRKPGVSDLQLDHQLSLVRAAYHAGSISHIDTAIRDGIAAGGSVEFNKEWVNLHILTRQLDEAENVCFAHLERHPSFNRAAFKAAVSAGRKLCFRAFESQAKGSGRDELAAFDEWVRSTAVEYNTILAPRDSTSVDFLYRLGEVYGERSESRDVETETNKESAVLRELPGFLRAFVTFKLAERLRELHFAEDPLNSGSSASGHSTRSMIRVAIKIENRLRQMRREAGGDDIDVNHSASRLASNFGEEARALADVLSQHHFRLPRERASMLILEATIARMLSTDRTRESDLKLAISFLNEAEPIVLRLDPQVRIRLRLWLERTKVLRALSRVYQERDDDSAAKVFTELARYDAVRLGRASLTPQWKQLAKLQLAKF